MSQPGIIDSIVQTADNSVAHVVSALNQDGGLNSAAIVVALSLTGTLTMSIIQIFKDLSSVLENYQRKWIARWLTKQAGDFNAAAEKGAPSADLKANGLRHPASMVAAEKMLVDLATGGDSHAFYDLPSEQLVAQMNAAVQIAMDYPSAEHYRDLFVVLAAGADIKDIDRVQSVPTPRLAPAPTAVTSSASPVLPAGYADARTRVANRIQRNLDGLQISMSDQWQLYLQRWAMIGSITIIEVTLLFGKNCDIYSLIIGVFVGIVGGYLAPVSRDIVVAIQNLRNP